MNDNIEPQDAVVFDFDSTASRKEGIDEAALMKGPEVCREVEELTNSAMSGAGMVFRDALLARLQLVQPTVADLQTLAEIYAANMVEGFADLIRWLREQNVQPLILSGGFFDAIQPVVSQFGFADSEILAVRLLHTEDGTYKGVNEWDPVTSALMHPQGDGKVHAARHWAGSLPGARVIAAVGDGGTDADLKKIGGVDFVHFAGVVDRPAVRAKADVSCHSMAEVQEALRARLSRLRGEMSEAV